MHSWSFKVATAIATTLFVGAVHAAEPAASGNESSANATEQQASEADTSNNEVGKDPRGIKGISPFWEALVAGDTALIGGDPDQAVTHYEEALKSEPQNPMGHYRMGQLLLIKGELEQSRTSLEAALRFGKQDAEVTAKALFALAALAEREGKYDAAASAWKKYEQHVTAHSEIHGFAASASERQKRIVTQQQMSRDYAAVKDRIKKREAELTEKALSGN